MPLVWDSKLDTGIEVIDNQHRRIVDYVNQLEAAQGRGDRALVGQVIEQLVDYTQSHFSFEESMMEEAGYKFLKPHQKVHEIFIKRVTEFTVRAAKNEDVALELHSMLTKWLLNHIASEDHDYSGVVLKMLARQSAAEDDTQKAKGGFMSGLLGRFFR
jgi:hemerythrin